MSAMDFHTNYGRAIYSDNFLCDTYSLYQRPAPTEADMGQEPDATYPDDWTILTDGAACRVAISNRLSNEAAAAGQVQGKMVGKLLAKWDSTRPLPQHGVRATFTTNGETYTVDFEVTGAPERSRRIYWSVDIEEIR